MLTIVHPTDLSVDEQSPFAHAVALASHANGELVALHANRPGEAPVGDIDAKPLLKLWGRDQQMPFSLMKHSCCEDPIDTALDALSRTTADLLVVGTHQRTGLERAFKDSFSESLALETHLPTLFVPIDGKGVVDMGTGELLLKKVLVPVGGTAALDRACDATRMLLDSAEIDDAQIVLLHVGDDPFPDVKIDAKPGWTVERVTRSGRIEDAIVGYCEENGVDLVVMGTEGHSSVLDFLRGSRTERVLRRAACPVLSVSLAG